MNTLKLADLPAEAVPVRDVLARCRASLELGVRYKLGAGGRDPTAASPANAAGLCDCSGFEAWRLFHDRKTSSGHWWNTDSIEADARKAGGGYTRIALPILGCTIVYGAGSKIGHVGGVDECPPPEVAAKMTWRELMEAIRVIHCAGRDRGRTSDGRKSAIIRTDGIAFGGNRPDCCFAVWAGVDYTAL
jgi:hypothetical protein